MLSFARGRSLRPGNPCSLFAERKNNKTESVNTALYPRINASISRLLLIKDIPNTICTMKMVPFASFLTCHKENKIIFLVHDTRQCHMVNQNKCTCFTQALTKMASCGRFSWNMGMTVVQCGQKMFFFNKETCMT